MLILLPDPLHLSPLLVLPALLHLSVPLRLVVRLFLPPLSRRANRLILTPLPLRAIRLALPVRQSLARPHMPRRRKETGWPPAPVFPFGKSVVS